MSQFTRKPNKFVCKGLGLANPPDLLPAGMYPILANVRADSEGTLSARAPLAVAVTAAGAASPILALRRLNDPTTSTYARIATDAAGNLLAGTTALVVKDTGFSGNPTCLVPYRPVQSAAPWIYVGDSVRSRKINVAGTVQLTGIVPPNTQPAIALAAPSYIDIADFGSSGIAPIASWTAGGTAGAPAIANRFNTTISKILYDTGTTGWCSIVLAVMDTNDQAGALILLNGTELVKIHDVFNAIGTTTIASIVYDTGTSGACCVVLTSPTAGLARDCVLTLNAELVRVLSVSVGPDGIPSFRCVTAGTHAAGESVTGSASFRAYTTAAHTTAETALGVALQTSVGTGVGYVTFIGAYNLSSVGNRPIANDDYIHVSVLVDHPENIVEGRFEFDISDGLYDNNYYYYPFTQSDLQANAIGSLTWYAAQQAALQKTIVEEQTGNLPLSSNGTPIGFNASSIVPGGWAYQYGPSQSQIQAMLAEQQAALASLTQLTSPQVVSGQTIAGAGQTVPGASQWTELLIPVSSLIRVGGDQTKTLANIVSIRLQLNCTATTLILTSSWWAGGTYGPDSGNTGTPFLAAYRYRSNTIGSRSNPSPSIRSGVYARRERLVISGLVSSTDPQVDTIDVFIFGGMNNNWALAASIPNAQTSVNIDLTNDALQLGESLQFDNYVPFPTTDLPRTGVCTVTGTSVVWVSGDVFNVKWTPGSSIIIGGVVYTFYDSPTSTTRLEIVQSAGYQSNVVFSIPQATLYGTPLPYICDGGNSNSGVIFAAGDPKNPGYLYWSNPNDPDTASDTHNLQVTSPSEPLYTPFTWNGQAYVFSSQRMFVISPSAVVGTQRVGFLVQEVPAGRGLFAPWFSCVGSTPVFGSNSGVYAWGGGTSVSLTDDSLLPLFPQADITGVSMNGYLAVDYTVPVALRLFWAVGEIYLLYKDSGGTRRMMRYDGVHGGGWFPYDTTPAPCCVYGEEGGEIESLLIGGADGALYKFVSTGAETVAAHVRTATLDMGDSRADKLFGDCVLDALAAGTITITPGFDTGSLATQAFVHTARTMAVLDFNAGAGVHAKKIYLDLAWTGAGTLYEFQPSFVVKPETIDERFSDWFNSLVGGNG